MKTFTLVLSMGLIATTPAAGLAQTAADLNNQVTAMNNATANQGQSQVIGKISSDFRSFLGSDATAVVTGLRNGTPITLSSTVAGPSPGGVPTTTTTVITPPTGQMGFGNVYISLALAKEQLSMMGITQPTPEQLQAALTGGTITTTDAAGVATTTELQGILTMRSEGMGWGQIAQKSGFKLGPVMSAMKSGSKNLAVSSASTSKGQDGSNVGGHSTPSSARSGVSSGSKAQGQNGSAAGASKGSNGSIVSASGANSGNAYGSGKSGIVTGAGRGVGAGGGIVSAGGGNQGVGRGKAPAK